MASSDRALLANLDVYVAEGNVRRGVIHLANNMLSQSGTKEFRERRMTVAKNTNTIFQSIDGNSATVLRCTKPVTVTLTFADGGETQVSFVVTSLLLLTTPVSDITIANESLTLDSVVQVLQI